MSDFDRLLHGNFNPFGNVAPEQIVASNVRLTEKLGPQFVGVVIHLQKPHIFDVQLFQTKTFPILNIYLK